MSFNEPQINASVRAYVHAQLAQGLAPEVVRARAIGAFVDLFAESAPDKSLVTQYQQQVATVVNETLLAPPTA